MASIRERTRKDGARVYSVQVRMSGFPARSASFRTRRSAERWAKTVEAEMIEGKHFRSAEARRRTLAEAIDRYLEHELPRKRDGTMHQTTLRWWREAIGELRLADVTPALIAEFRDRLAGGTYQRSTPGSKHSKVDGAARRFPRSPSTVNRYLSCLSHVFTVARKEWRWVNHNPVQSVSKLRQPTARVRVLSDAERRALLRGTSKDPMLHAFVMIALTTACRAGELLKLSWSDVDLATGRLLFRETKNAEPRTSWVQGAALDLLNERARTRPQAATLVFGSGAGRGCYQYHKPFRAAVEAAGLCDFRFHDLRHTAATYLAQQGATEQQLRAIGGWKSGVVARYVHLAAEDAKAALAKLALRIDE